MMDALRELHFLVGRDKLFTPDFHQILVQSRTGAVGDTLVDFQLSHNYPIFFPIFGYARQFEVNCARWHENWTAKVAFLQDAAKLLPN